jgi:hypothetical protein
MTLGGGKVRRRPKSERSEADFYPTPAYATEAMLTHLVTMGVLKPGDHIWEPAAGNGAMVEVIGSHDFFVWASDLRVSDDVYGERGMDFLAQMRPPKLQTKHIFTNPPYALSKEFLLKGLWFLQEFPQVESVTYLYRLAFLEGAFRGRIFQETPPAHVLVFSKRLPWYDSETKQMREKDGQYAHAAYTWTKASVRGDCTTTLHWHL